ncbi:MAG: glycosyltransferase family 4 protein [Chloroflexota bacterium]|nr:glycosyltransferase family 4 protein [Chloroflexota bacterium]MDP6758181.1 glycosyltransferase family 4 protein [Chloroflexota bacterium]
MKVGVYNRWLHTFGGGERHSCMTAAVLAAEHEVELISHRGLDKDELGRRLNVDLDRVGLRVVPAMPANRFREFTREYDLFVNASFMTGQPAAAKRRMMLVLFPSPMDKSLGGRLRRWVGQAIIRELLLPEYIDGFYDVQELGEGWFRYSTTDATVRLRNPRRGRDVRVEIMLGNFRPATPGAVEAEAVVEGETVGRVALAPEKGTYRRWLVDVPGRLTSGKELDLTIRAPTYNPQTELGEDDNREIGVAVTDAAVLHPRHGIYKLLFRKLFRGLGLRLEGVTEYASLDYLDSYDLICPISEFSREWMHEYWDKDGPILYPPVAVDDFSPGEKAKVILSVGRFFGAGGHSKRHDTLIAAFKQMVTENPQELEGWELHVAGNRGTRPVDAAYYAGLERAAAGAPVVLHPDLPFAELQDLYARAAIYWHASGYGQDERRDPVKFEHFGITTVEAMAAGCVPVVINRGGQPELVTAGVDGALWETLDELMARTGEIIADRATRERLAARAVTSAERFSEERFRDRLLELVATLAPA